MEHIFQNWPNLDFTHRLRICCKISKPQRGYCNKWSFSTLEKGRRQNYSLIATQNYSMHIYSLCHLLAALSAAKVEYEILYDFKSTITKQTIEQLFVTNFQTSAFKVKNDSIEFACKSGSVWFAYSLAQGPLSLCLFDFLNESVGILELKNAYHHLGAVLHNSKSALYLIRFLKKYIPT